MPEREPDSFDEIRLPAEVEAHLRDTNPWWRGPTWSRASSLPPVGCSARSSRRVDARVAPALVLRGAPQVGKTTLQEQVIQHLLAERSIDPRRIGRACDGANGGAAAWRRPPPVEVAVGGWPLHEMAQSRQLFNE
jgi:hypothetical protein